jgi:hypothetical protein
MGVSFRKQDLLKLLKTDNIMKLLTSSVITVNNTVKIFVDFCSLKLFILLYGQMMEDKLKIGFCFKSFSLTKSNVFQTKQNIFLS